MKCARCDWRSTTHDGPEREQLLAHARDKQHPLCISCHRSLLPEEQQTCEDRISENGRGCVQRGRALITGILTSWVDLHGEPQPWPRTAMLGLGGRGDMPRELSPTEARNLERWWILGSTGPLSRLEWQILEAARAGKEHLADNHLSDPPAIAYELGRWEDDWRETRGDPLSTIGGNGRALRAAAKYLEAQMRWAGRHHPAFDEFLKEMTDLHDRCQAAVGRAPAQPQALDVLCLEEGCRGHLQHPLVQTSEQAEPLQWWLGGAVGPLTLVDWKRLKRTWQGEVVNHKTAVCKACGTAYTPQRYVLAQAETRRRRGQVLLDGETYMQISRVAHDLGRNRQTLHTWVKQGLIRSRLLEGSLFVHVDEATAAHLERPVQIRRRAS